MIEVVYPNLCPNCGGPITSTRAILGLLCERCVPNYDTNGLPSKAVPDRGERVVDAYLRLIGTNSLLGLWDNYIEISEYNKLVGFFKQVTGLEPRSLQRYWLFRMARGESFALSAPTGMGKTTTLMVYAGYSALARKNVLFVVPTASLRDQIQSRLKQLYGSEAVHNVRVVTSTYMNRNVDEIRAFKPKLVILDDADAFLKSGKSTDKLVEVLGFSVEAYRNAIELVRLKSLALLSKKNKEEQEEIRKKIEQLSRELTNTQDVAQLLVASATLRPKGAKQRALRELLNFDVSTVQLYTRNVVDAFTKRSLREVLETLKERTLVLVSKDKGKSGIREAKELAESLGLRVGLAVSGRRFLDKLSRGEYDVLIGSASQYGVAVRGIDEPNMIYNVVFYGVPKHRFRVEDYLNNPLNSIKTLVGLNKLSINEISEFLRLSNGELTAIRLALKNNSQLTGKLGQLAERARALKEEALEALSSEVKGSLLIGFTAFRKVEGNVIVEVPDHVTYLQGSGRASRLTPFGLTLGLSLTIVDDDLIYELLLKRLRSLNVSVNPVEWESLDYQELKEKMRESREKRGKEVEIKTALLIVESPVKARTISRLFGKSTSRTISGVRVYETIIPVEEDSYYLVNVVATKGHLTDLTTDSVGLYGIETDGSRIRMHYSWLKRCMKCGRTFASSSDSCPYCGSADIISSEKVAKVLRRLSIEVDDVLIATDPDVEGEKIAFDVANVVAFYNTNVRRITYHEVTKQGIISALRSPRTIDMGSVYAHLVRRAEDRIVGFKVSNVLKDELSDANNGSGRVQGPVLKWIAKRYEDYVRNKGYVGLVNLGDVRFRVFLGKEKKERLRIIVRKLDETTTVISPKPPFTTDQLLEEASKTFGWSPSQIMRLAQDLFETGLITYHRTDSSHVSSYGIEIARNYLTSNDLLSEFQPRQWGGPGTHEAIRPTSPVDAKTLSEQVLVNPVFNRLTTAHLKLYDLIFRRFIASQMRPATARIAKYEVEFDGLERRVVEIVTEARGGFVSVYPLKTGRLEEGEFEVPVRVSLGSAIQLLDYPEVVRLMKEYRIGRPSTYVRTIQAIMRHGYVIESKRAKKLIITRKGMRAYRVLESKFPELLEESTTARLLDALDKVAQGAANPEDLIRSSVASYFESVLPNDSYEYV